MKSKKFAGTLETGYYYSMETIGFNILVVQPKQRERNGHSTGLL